MYLVEVVCYWVLLDKVLVVVVLEGLEEILSWSLMSCLWCFCLVLGDSLMSVVVCDVGGIFFLYIEILIYVMKSLLLLGSLVFFCMVYGRLVCGDFDVWGFGWDVWLSCIIMLWCLGLWLGWVLKWWRSRGDLFW